VTRDQRQPKLPGDGAQPLDAVQAAAWVETRERLQGLVQKMASSREIRAEDLEMPRLDLNQVLNALQVPSDAGGLAADLERILRRIPDGWGRWIGCGKGWYPLIVELDQRLADLDPGYHVHQVKEKYGTLSYYVQGAPFVAAAMEALVEQAEAESARICEQCGGEGVLMEDCGWYATRCRACTRGSRYRPAER
jgi:hypothetical protein